MASTPYRDITKNTEDTMGDNDDGGGVNRCQVSGCPCAAFVGAVGSSCQTCSHGSDKHSPVVLQGEESLDSRSRNNTVIVHDSPRETVKKPTTSTVTTTTTTATGKTGEGTQGGGEAAPPISLNNQPLPIPLPGATGSPEPVPGPQQRAMRHNTVDASSLPPVQGIHRADSLPGLPRGRGLTGDSELPPSALSSGGSGGGKAHTRARSRTVNFQPQAPLPSVTGTSAAAASQAEGRTRSASGGGTSIGGGGMGHMGNGAFHSGAGGGHEQTIPLLLPESTRNSLTIPGQGRMGRRRSRTVNLHITGGPNPQLYLSPGFIGHGAASTGGGGGGGGRGHGGGGGGGGGGLPSARSTPAPNPSRNHLMTEKETAEILGRLEEKMTRSVAGGASRIQGGRGGDGDGDGGGGGASDSDSDAPRPLQSDDEEEATLAYEAPSRFPEDEFAELKTKRLIHPNSIWRSRWDVFIVVVLMYTVVVLPYRICFNDPAEGGMLGFEVFIDVMFGLDIVLNFRTAYYHKAALITNPRQIAKHYAKTWFGVDFIATFPFDIIVIAIVEAHTDGDLDNSNLLSIPRLVRGIRLVKMIRLMRLFRLSRIFRKMQAHVTVNGAVMKLIRLGMVMSMLAHLFACLWFLIASLEPDPTNTWAGQLGLFDDHKWEQYVTSLYWALCTVTTVGYGEIVPVNSGERCFVVITMLIGVTAFAFAVGTMSSLVQQIDRRSTDFQNKMAEINRYLKYRDLPRSLQFKIREHQRYMYEREAVLFQESKILYGMSKTLRTEVAMHLNEKILRNVPFLRKADNKLISQVVLSLKPRIASVGDYICTAGEVGNEMFILTRGQAEVLSPDGEQVYATLDEGSYFGEVALVSENSRRMAHVVALTHCDLFVLPKEAFESIISDFPDTLKEINRIAAERANQNKRIMQHSRTHSNVNSSTTLGAAGSSATDHSNTPHQSHEDSHRSGSDDSGGLGGGNTRPPAVSEPAHLFAPSGPLVGSGESVVGEEEDGDLPAGPLTVHR